jgi:hypothetical protein
MFGEQLLACLNDIPPVSLYSPGMWGRSNALVIDLATNEQRDDLDFTSRVRDTFPQGYCRE